LGIKSTLVIKDVIIVRKNSISLLGELYQYKTIKTRDINGLKIYISGKSLKYSAITSIKATISKTPVKTFTLLMQIINYQIPNKVNEILTNYEYFKIY
jgi:hypothetical protein